jgi:hypothetical protein
MKILLDKVRGLSTINFYIIFLLIVFLPVIFYGHFIQDDYSITSLNEYNFLSAIERICSVNSNRPLSCLYHAALSRFPSIFKIYFLIDLIIYFISIILIIKAFDFIINSKSKKKLFFSLAIIPFFSYTILYSPGMQSMGTVAFLFWAISIFLLKNYLTTKKTKFLFFSYLSVLVLFLIYESSFPLLSLTIFFPLLYEKKFKYKFFLLNLIINISILIFVLILQKKVFTSFSIYELSRVKLGFTDVKTILYLTFVNFLLIVNIFFHSLELFIYNLASLVKNFNTFLIFQIFLTFIFILSNFPKKNDFKNDKSLKKLSPYYNYYILISVFGVLMMTSLMHALANTGLEFLMYNNRALVSVSLIFSFLIFNFIIYVPTNKTFNKYKFIASPIIVIFITNFFFFQNNLLNENKLSKKLYSSIKEQKNNFIKKSNTEKKKLLLVFKTNLNKSQTILNYQSMDAFKELMAIDYKIIVINITENRVCNKFYFNPYIKIFLNDDYSKHLLIYDSAKLKIVELKNIKSLDIEDYLKNLVGCKKNNSRTISNKERYMYKNDSMFIKSMSFLYSKYF